jgi:hypothetical protein
MQNLGDGNPDVGMKLAQQRLHTHKNKNGKLMPSCLACGAPAHNELPTCGEAKGNRLVRPIFRWAKRVAALTTTRGYKKAA